MRIRQLVHGRGKHAVQSSGLEKDHERIDIAGKPQLHAAVCLETHNLDTLTGLDEGPITPMDLIRIAKLEFEERRSPRRNWMNQRGTSHMSFQVRVQANVMGQLRCRAG
jgi:hypothetical protein